MSFNTDKCKVLHVGRSNSQGVYTMNGTPLAVTEKERDIGVIISHTLKPSSQCSEAARRASAVLTQISKAFLYRDRKVFLQLYKSFVRCHLEFAVTSWAPWSNGDIDILERIQRRAVNLVTGLRGRTYEEKLSELGLKSLRERRIQYDLVQTFKILRGIDRVDKAIWFNEIGQIEHIPTRNTTYAGNLVQARSRTDVRKYFYSNRVVPIWNALPTEVKDARTVNIFKSRLEEIKLT